MKSPIQLFVALAVLLATATVAAQVYKWVDKDGKTQYTDTPPPASASKAEPKTLKTDAAPAADAKAAPKSLQERSKESEKRAKDEAEKSKKDEENQKIAKNNEEACKDAMRFKTDLESGRPLSRSNDQGERTFMTDAERDSETARMKSIIAEACSKK